MDDVCDVLVVVLMLCCVVCVVLLLVMCVGCVCVVMDGFWVVLEEVRAAREDVVMVRVVFGDVDVDVDVSVDVLLVLKLLFLKEIVVVLNMSVVKNLECNVVALDVVAKARSFEDWEREAW